MIMELPIRLENAITKLYNAFHEGTLNAMDCKACACGNICNNTDEWSYDGKSHYGYSKYQLATIESLFMHGYRHDSGKYVFGRGWLAVDIKSKNNELVFKALCAVVEYLCELDNIPNVMDYTKLFETENDKPKYALV